MGKRKTANGPLNKREREAFASFTPHGQEVAETLRSRFWRNRESVRGTRRNRPRWLPGKPKKKTFGFGIQPGPGGRGTI